jgi:hypothetical protein
MKRERVQADYEAAVPRIPDRVNQQLASAREFLSRLTALPPALPKP